MKSNKSSVVYLEPIEDEIDEWGLEEDEWGMTPEQ